MERLEAMKLTGFLEHLGCRVNRLESGYSEVSLEIHQGLHNPSGTVHGGVYATLIDAGLSLAGLSLLPIPGPVRVVQLNINMIRSTATGELITKTQILNRGNSSFFGTAQIFSDEGHLVAHGTGTVVGLRIAQKN